LASFTDALGWFAAATLAVFVDAVAGGHQLHQRAEMLEGRVNSFPMERRVRAPARRISTYRAHPPRTPLPNARRTGAVPRDSIVLTRDD